MIRRQPESEESSTNNLQRIKTAFARRIPSILTNLITNISSNELVDPCATKSSRFEVRPRCSIISPPTTKCFRWYSHSLVRLNCPSRLWIHPSLQRDGIFVFFWRYIFGCEPAIRGKVHNTSRIELWRRITRPLRRA